MQTKLENRVNWVGRMLMKIFSSHFNKLLEVDLLMLALLD